MRFFSRTVIIILSITMGSVAFSQDVSPNVNIVENNTHYDHVVWNGIPISFVVPVGQERILRFDGPVVLNNTDSRFTSDKVSILNNAGFLYIKAKKFFRPIRLSFAMKNTGKVVLIDLSAKKNASDTPVSVVIQNEKTNGNSVSKVQNKQNNQSVNEITLIRYAIQHLYAPGRLIKENVAISRTPMQTERSIHLFDNENVMALPIVSYRGGDLYVTAVLLKNNYDQKIMLDQRGISGHWLAASFYPSNFLTKKGSKHDRTTLFLVSDRPFVDALNQMKGYRS